MTAFTCRRRAFGYNGNGVPISVNTRREITIHRRQRLLLGSYSAPPQSLGGWSLSVNHVYDPIGQTLYEGNGRRRSVQTVSNGIDTFAGGQSGFLVMADRSVQHDSVVPTALRQVRTEASMLLIRATHEYAKSHLTALSTLSRGQRRWLQSQQFSLRATVVRRQAHHSATSFARRSQLIAVVYIGGDETRGGLRLMALSTESPELSREVLAVMATSAKRANK